LDSVLPGAEAEDITGGNATLLEALDITRSKEEEPLISAVFLELQGLDPSGPDQVQDRFFALAGKERGFRRQDPIGQVPRRVSLVHLSFPHGLVVALVYRPGDACA
jgi:hypothetical protein